jgi:hypothetical protein
VDSGSGPPQDLWVGPPASHWVGPPASGLLKWLAGVQAWVELEAGKPDAVLELAARGMRDNAWTLYQEAVARDLKGDAAARKAFTDLARWNQNDLGHALVRAKVLTRAGEAQWPWSTAPESAPRRSAAATTPRALFMASRAR